MLFHYLFLGWSKSKTIGFVVAKTWINVFLQEHFKQFTCFLCVWWWWGSHRLGVVWVEGKILPPQLPEETPLMGKWLASISITFWGYLCLSHMYLFAIQILLDLQSLNKLHLYLTGGFFKTVNHTWEEAKKMHELYNRNTIRGSKWYIKIVCKNTIPCHQIGWSS